MTNTLIRAYRHPDHASLTDAVQQAFNRLLHEPSLHYAPIFGWDNYILVRVPDAPTLFPPYELQRIEWCTETWDHMAELVSETSMGLYTTIEEITSAIEKELP